MINYLLLYQVSAYDGWSTVSVTLLAKDDAEAKELASRAWELISSYPGSNRPISPKLHDLTHGVHLDWKP